MNHYFRYKDGYVIANTDTINIIYSKKLNSADFNGNSILHQSKLLFYLIYFIAVGVCIWWQSYLLLVLITAIMGVKYISGREADVITIPAKGLIDITQKDKLTIVTFYTEESKKVELELPTIGKKDFEVLRNLI